MRCYLGTLFILLIFFGSSIFLIDKVVNEVKL